MSVLDRAIALQARAMHGAAVIDVATHPATLTPAEAGCAHLLFTGTLTADAVFTLPAAGRPQRIENAAAGGFDLKVRRAGGTMALAIPQGETVEVR